MAALIFLLLNLAASLFKPRGRLEAENAALRQQLIVLQRKVRGRVQFTNRDRLFFVQLYRSFPSALKAITIIRPETLVRWHRAGFPDRVVVVDTGNYYPRQRDGRIEAIEAGR
jgi:hypothetical protein